MLCIRMDSIHVVWLRVERKSYGSSVGMQYTQMEKMSMKSLKFSLFISLLCATTTTARHTQCAFYIRRRITTTRNLITMNIVVFVLLGLHYIESYYSVAAVCCGVGDFKCALNVLSNPRFMPSLFR